jgi:hypothetical protein
VSLRRLVVGGIVAVAVSTGACSTKAAMTAEDARAFTARALARVGYANAVVDGNPSRARYKSPDPRFNSDPPVEVWQTRAVVPDGEVELYVQRRGDSAVFVRDTRTSGGRLLTDAQFKALGRFRFNAADDRRRDSQRMTSVIGVVLVVAVGASLLATVITGAADRRQRVHSARRH